MSIIQLSIMMWSIAAFASYMAGGGKGLLILFVLFIIAGVWDMKRSPKKHN